MKKIAHFIEYYLNFTETFIYEQIKNIPSFKQIILTKKTNNTELFPHPDVYSLSNLSRLREWFEYYSYNKFGKFFYFEDLIKKNNVGLLHAHFGPSGVYILPLKERLDIPMITSFYGYDASSIPTQNPQIYEELFRKGELFTVLSDDMKGNLIDIGCPSEKILIHKLGIDIDKFRFRETEPEINKKVKILFVGRLEEKKGVLYAVKAFFKARKVHKNIEFRIIGDGILKKKLEEIIINSKYSKDVVLLGNQPQSKVIEEMYNSHLFILPGATAENGDKEGTPTVLMEAQATGMPVVSTYHAGIPEIVIDNKTGFLVDEGDIDALSEKLSYLIEHPEIWSEFGKNGRKHVEKRYNINKQVKKLEKIYEDLTQVT